MVTFIYTYIHTYIYIYIYIYIYSQLALKASAALNWHLGLGNHGLQQN